jgi:protease-4
MKRFILLLIFITILSGFMSAQSGVSAYHEQRQFQLTSPGALKIGLYGFDNPALLEYARKPDIYFTFSDATGKWNDFNQWGGFIAFRGISFGAIQNRGTLGTVTDYRVSAGGGDRSFSAGLGIGWSSGATEQYDRQSFITFGTLWRPDPHFSFGLVGVKSFRGKNAEAAADIAVRPLGDQLFTAFLDYGIDRNQMLKDGMWSAGAVVEPLPGIRFIGRYYDTKTFSFGVQFSLGTATLETQSNYDRDRKHLYNTYGIHIGAYDRNIFDTYCRARKSYLDINLKGPVSYQQYRLFDRTNTLSDLLNSIEAAKEDTRVAGIAINISSIEADQEKLWELREKLKEFKAGGKHLIIFMDRANINIYHFASVADKIVMDPMGILMLEGYSMGRTYFKGTLDKLGIGYDEWRFFKYKSANEVLSRENMSDAEREQYQNLVKDYYRLARTDICASRGLIPEKFDSLVNTEIALTGQKALEKKLVDTLGRWETVKDVIAKLEGEKQEYRTSGSLLKNQLPFDNRWGEPSHIALIYALGICAMDDGIKARSLVNNVNTAVENSSIKAIVLRVDSPGGDGLASDYIAEALKKAKGKKPVIISQGYVAGSGGYWLSMYGDTIVAAPNTITGSIGVAGGWMYNKGAKEWMGLSTDHVQVGSHADLGFGPRLPFIGLSLPDRNLTTEERGRVEEIMKDLYKEFVQKVADGRKKTFSEIDSVAQGRFYSGYEGKEKGLVDVIGGLETAIAIAKERAGIPLCEEVVIEEMPEKGLININALMAKVLPYQMLLAEDKFVKRIEFLMQHNGEVIPLMPPEFIEMVPDEE